MFEGLDKIEWDKIDNQFRRSRYPFTDIPNLLPKLLDIDEEVSQQALIDLFALVVQDDSISYFTEAAPVTIPFIMEVFRSENYPHKAKIVEGLNAGLTYYEDFAPSNFEDVRNESFKQAQISSHAILRDYLDDFIELLSHNDVATRRDIVEILSRYPQDSERLLPILLKYVESEFDSNLHPVFHSQFLFAIKMLIIYGNPSREDLQHFIQLSYREFQKADGYRLWSALDILKTSPIDTPDEIVQYIYQQFDVSNSAKTTAPFDKVARLAFERKSEQLFAAFLMLLDLLETQQLKNQDVVVALMNWLRHASHNQISVILTALELKLSPSHLAELNQALLAKLRAEPVLMNEITLAQRKDELRPNKLKFSGDKDLVRAYQLALKGERSEISRESGKLAEKQVDEPSLLEQTQELGRQILRFLGLGE